MACRTAGFGARQVLKIPWSGERSTADAAAVAAKEPPRTHKRSTMKLRTKLTTLLLVCGIAPMAIAVTIAWLTGRGSTVKLVAESCDTLRAGAETDLKGNVASRGRHIQSYFDFIRQSAQSLGSNAGMHEAIAAFSAGLAELTAASKADAAGQSAMKLRLASFYQGDFAAEYRRKTDGRVPATDSILAVADEVMVVAQSHYLATNPNPIGQKHRLDGGAEGTAYGNAHAKFHPWMRNLSEVFGYYDVFLIDPSGRIVYSVFKEADFGTSLATGPWRDSGMGGLFRKLQTTAVGEWAFADFEVYTPSYEAPAAFVGSPISRGSERLGYIAFQVPIDRVNAIMANWRDRPGRARSPDAVRLTAPTGEAERRELVPAPGDRQARPAGRSACDRKGGVGVRGNDQPGGCHVVVRLRADRDPRQAVVHPRDGRQGRGARWVGHHAPDRRGIRQRDAALEPWPDPRHEHRGRRDRMVVLASDHVADPRHRGGTQGHRRG
jgi:hypothetical protein